MKQNNMNYKNILSVAFLMVVIGVFVFFTQAPQKSLGSVIRGGEYYSTTTASMTQVHNQITSDRSTTLGSIVVSSSSAQTLVVWNATSTTDTASTTFTTLKASIGEGTYTFDAILPRGLVVETPSGFDGDYVVTFRP